jgi:hypothetical protein
LLRRLQRRTAVWNLIQLVRHHLAAVPQIARVQIQQSLARRDENLISGLRIAALPGLQFPSQPGLRRIHSQRVSAKVAREIGGCDGLALNHSKRQQNKWK